MFVEWEIAGLSSHMIWTIIFVAFFTVLTNFIYYWYLFHNGDKKYF